MDNNTINTIANIGIFVSSICNVMIAFLLYLKTSKNYKADKIHKEEIKKIQNEHNMKSVQPVVYIACQQISDSVRVEIRNYGLGVMIIRDIIIKDKNSANQMYHALYEIFPDKIKLNNYAVDTKGRPIGVNGYITLVDFRKLDKEDIKVVRDTLGKYTIRVVYQDVYGNVSEKEKDFYDIFCIEYRSQ